MLNLLMSLVIAMLAACSSPPKSAQNSTASAVKVQPAKASSGARTVRYVETAPPAARAEGSDGEHAVVVKVDGNVVNVNGQEIDLAELGNLAELEGIDEDSAKAIHSMLFTKALAGGANGPQGASAGNPFFSANRVLRTNAMMQGVEYDEKAAFLGVGTEPVNPQTAAQLPLMNGTGLVLTAVEEGSPAAEAGLKQFDVLAKVNDQLLVNAAQMAVLVRANKPGDDIKLTYLRGGKESTVSVKLASRRLPKLGPGGARADGGFASDSEVALVSPAMGANGFYHVTGNLQSAPAHPAMPAVLELMSARAGAAHEAPSGESSGEDNAVNVNYNTDDTGITYSSDDGDVHMTVKDLDSGATVFDEDRLPLKADLEAMRPEVRKDVERMMGDIGGGKKLRRAPGVAPKAPHAPKAPSPPVPPTPPTPPSAATPDGEVEDDSPVMM